MKTIKPGSEVSRALQFDAAGINVEARTAELSFSSETPILEEFLFERVFVILDHKESSVRLDRLRNGAPLLKDHTNSIDSQIGIIEEVSIGADMKGRALVRFGKSEADDVIFQKVQDGIIRNVSARFRVHEAVNDGIKNDVDVFRAVDWEPLEISLVSVPADASVGVGRAESKTKFELIEIQREVTEMAEPTEVKQVASVDNTEAIRLAVESARNADLKRTADIMAIGEDHAARGGVAIALKAVKEGQSVEDFQRDLLVSLKAPVKEAQAPTFEQGARVEENSEKDEKRGFKSLGHFCRYTIGVSTNNLDPEFSHVRAATTFANESSGPDGGLAVPPAFSNEIARPTLGEQSLLSMTDATPVEGNSMTFPKDETTPWGSTGIQSYWDGEASTATQNKPVISSDTLKLHKLRTLVPVTDELLADSSAMSSYITNKMGEALEWKIQDAIINGTGAGMPLGITAAAALVTQAKVGSQTADTIVAGNATSMYGRVIQSGNLVWLVNPDAWAQLPLMTIGDQPAWTMPNGLKDAPNGILLGRPVVLTDACQTLGDKNDFILANMSGYRTLNKSSGFELSSSIHLWFDQDVAAFKLIFRLAGQPTFSAPITPPNSSVTRSHFVTLAARA